MDCKNREKKHKKKKKKKREDVLLIISFHIASLALFIGIAVTADLK